MLPPLVSPHNNLFNTYTPFLHSYSFFFFNFIEKQLDKINLSDLFYLLSLSLVLILSFRLIYLMIKINQLQHKD